IADAARSFLDGHIVLSRTLADAGHYPAIDIEQSISRVMTAITPMDHQLAARRVKALWSRYQRSREMITIGAYAPGSDAQTDLAIQLMPQIERFLCQEVHDRCSLVDSRDALDRLLGIDSRVRTTLKS
ncbi:MAG TPA: flagellum-specific ATP synthase FliI, partial [Lautropia sp.]|nr:flagellum-specific ATP synthase FliI [Lautropia sp.]